MDATISVDLTVSDKGRYCPFSIACFALSIAELYTEIIETFLRSPGVPSRCSEEQIDDPDEGH